MIRRSIVAVAVALLLLTGCGDDSGGDDGEGNGDAELIQLLQDEAHQPESIANCVAERLLADDDVDRDQLEGIIRGEGATDLATADAYRDAAIACARVQAGDPSATTVG